MFCQSSLKQSYNSCLIIVEKIKFRVTHIFCEGNACVNKLPNLGFIHKISLV